MKLLTASITAILLLSCETQPKLQDKDLPPATRRDTVVIHDTIRSMQWSKDWQKGFGLTNDPDKDSVWGKPVSYYIDDTTCSWTAKDFYYGVFRPDDGGATHDLLAHVHTANDRLRPFYRWILTKTIQVTDGALAELTGGPARRYVEKYPREFIEYIDHDTTGARAKEWAGAISYSGFYDGEDYNDPRLVRQNILTAMKKNCSGCDAQTMKRIEEFARLCFDAYADAG